MSKYRHAQGWLLFGDSGMARCPKCKRTDWLSNFLSQGCDCGFAGVQPPCKCYYCANDNEHPDDRQPHGRWYPVTGLLLRAESLDQEDVIPMVACRLCGHRRAADSRYPENE